MPLHYLPTQTLWVEHCGTQPLAWLRSHWVPCTSSLLGLEDGMGLWHLRTGALGHWRASHLLAFLPSVWGLLSLSASLSSSVGLWGSERGNAVFKVSTIALITICRVGGAGSVWLCKALMGSDGEESSHLSALYTTAWKEPAIHRALAFKKIRHQPVTRISFSPCLEQSSLHSKTSNTMHGTRSQGQNREKQKLKWVLQTREYFQLIFFFLHKKVITSF